MSPILMRPVREQLEHDRVIRLLQTRWRRRYQVGINVGNEQVASAGPAATPLYPDLVLWSGDHRHVEGIVEVETGESINNMEALAEWVPFGRLRAPFYLYLPNGSVDNAKRLIADNRIQVSEIWTYYTIGDQIRFTLVHKAPEATPVREKRAAAPRRVATRTRTRPRTATPRRKSGATSRTRTAAKRAPAKRAAKTARKRTVKKASRTAARTQKRK